MNDTYPPQSPPPPPPATPPPGGPATSTGLDPKLAGLLSYILTPITGIIFFLIEKTNTVVRFHAAQSIVFGVFVVALMIVISILTMILVTISFSLGSLFGLLSTLLWLGVFIVWIILLVKGYSGEKWKLPVLGDLAERMAGRPGI